jgi:hypothetical protein
MFFPTLPETVALQHTTILMVMLLIVRISGFQLNSELLLFRGQENVIICLKCQVFAPPVLEPPVNSVLVVERVIVLGLSQHRNFEQRSMIFGDTTAICARAEWKQISP